MMLETIDKYLALKRLKDYERRVKRSARFIKHIIGYGTPQFAMTLGSGLQDLASTMKISSTISYDDIPGFPHCTADGHEGKLIIGTIEGVRVLGLQGRIHYYENAFVPGPYAMQEATFAVNVAADLKIPHFLSTNAAGAVNSIYQPADLMVIKSHIGFFIGANNPLLSLNHMQFDTVGEATKQYFPSTRNAYDKELSDLLYGAGINAGARMHKGNFAWVPGTNYETDAEIMALNSMGADAVGMSVVPECLTASEGLLLLIQR